MKEETKRRKSHFSCSWKLAWDQKPSRGRRGMNLKKRK